MPLKDKAKQKQYSKEYYEKNKDKIIKYGKKYYKNNRDKCKEYSKEYYHDHKDYYSINAASFIIRNDEETGRNFLVTRLSTKYRFFQSFLRPAIKFLGDNKEFQRLFDKMIELPTLTKKQRKVLVLLRKGYTTLEIAKMTKVTQPSVCKMLNGNPQYDEDHEGKYYGGICKKIINVISNANVKNEDLKLLVDEFKINYQNN